MVKINIAIIITALSHSIQNQMALFICQVLLEWKDILYMFKDLSSQALANYYKLLFNFT